MTISRPSKFLAIALGTIVLALGAGCSLPPGYDEASSNPAYNINRSAVDDGYGSPLSFQASAPANPEFGSYVKLPAKDPHAFGIGVLLPTDPNHQALAKSIRQGLELAVADVNAAGGINGQPIQLDVVDSSPDAAGALRDHGEAVILDADANLAVAQAERWADYPQLIGFLCDYVSVPRLTPKNGVRVYLNGDQEARVIENYIEASGDDHVTVVHTNDLLGESHQQYLLFIASGDHNITTESEGYTPHEHNFALLAQAVFHSTNGALVLVGNGPEYADILTAFDTAGWPGMVLGYADNAPLASLAGAGRLEQVAAYPLPDFAVNPRATDAGRAFADQYKAKYGEDPALPAAYAYDNIRVLAVAAAQAMSGDPLKIRASFIALRNYVGVVGQYDIKDDGDTEMPLRLWHANGQPAPDAHSTAPAPIPTDLQKLPSSNFSAPGQP